MEQVEAELLENCVATALQLLALLREEEKALLEFEGERLLEILPQKEALAGELDARLQSLRSRAMSRKGPSDSGLSGLSGHLAEIVALNRRNQVFIESSLSYWEEMLSLFIPTSYGGIGEKGRWEPRDFGAKGFAINREV